MKQLLTILTVFFCVAAIVGCEQKDPKDSASRFETDVVKRWGWNTAIRVIDVDGCEYVVAEQGTSEGGISIIHKQNCSNHSEVTGNKIDTLKVKNLYIGGVVRRFNKNEPTNH